METSTAFTADRALLAGLLDESTDALLALDDHGTVVFANAAAAALLGEEQRQLHGTSVASRLHRDDRRAFRRMLSSLGPGRPQAVLRTRLAGDAARAERLTVALRLLDDDGTCAVRVARSKEPAPGATAVDERAALEVEWVFVQNAAHQLRTPLAGIANAVELLQAGAKDDPVARDRFLAHLERETQRLASLARALLVLARAQAGVQVPRLEFVELAPLLKRVAGRLEPRREVELHVGCPPHVTAFAEPDLLEEALTALAENAAQHTRRGRIVLRCIARGDTTVEIEVEDSGDGIAPEHQKLIFDPFFRATTHGDRFGIGLSIAAQAVTALGAELAVDSAPGRGSRFSFRLPAAEVVTT